MGQEDEKIPAVIQAYVGSFSHSLMRPICAASTTKLPDTTRTTVLTPPWKRCLFPRVSLPPLMSSSVTLVDTKLPLETSVHLS